MTIERLPRPPANPAAPAWRVQEPVRWESADPELWQTFTTWSEWALTRWEVPTRVVPTCWARHPVLVEELTAAWTAWCLAFCPENSGWAPMDWLERWADTRLRMASASEALLCGTDGEHREPTVPRPHDASPLRRPDRGRERLRPGTGPYIL